MRLQREHRRTQSLLPWFVNESLQPKEREQVLRHLVRCRDCQQERDRLYELQQLIQESETPQTIDDVAFQRLMGRIDISERNRESIAELPEDLSVRDSWNFPRRFWWSFSAAASVLLLMGSLLLQGNNSVPAPFQTLSVDKPRDGTVYRMEVGFVTPIPALTLRQALIDTQSDIVTGPDELGRYIVEVALPDGTGSDAYLAGIRSIEGVEHARFVGD